MQRGRLTLTSEQWQELIGRGQRQDGARVNLAWPFDRTCIRAEHLLGLLGSGRSYYSETVRDGLLSVSFGHSLGLQVTGL